MSFKIHYHQIILDISLEITKPIYLKKIQIGKKRKAKFKVIIEIGKDFISQVTT